MDLTINSTYIVLIPKENEPLSVTYYRPFSNVLYKVIPMSLVNRLKHVLNVVISNNQSTFIPGRLISDNIVVAYEFLHSIKKRRYRKVGKMAIKLDTSKAYDRVEWSYLEEVMRKMGFDTKLIALVMKFVTTISYEVLLNRQLGEVFRPSRGLRQGDLLLPYLFLLCVEGLSNLISYSK